MKDYRFWRFFPAFNSYQLLRLMLAGAVLASSLLAGFAIQLSNPGTAKAETVLPAIPAG